MSSTRLDGRSFDELRPIRIEANTQRNPEGSLIYRSGATAILVAVSVDEGVRDWMRGKGSGWATAEYAMHPRANPRRQGRDSRRGRMDGRSTEIQRLIGRSLRSAIDLPSLGERTLHVDCDVLDADGGTRTASISGGFVAIAMALDGLWKRGLVMTPCLRAPVAAVSVGLVNGKPMLDLDYPEDSAAEVDLNVVATSGGGLIEVQGTAEGAPMPRASFDAMLDVALAGIATIVEQQSNALDEAGVDWRRLLISPS